MDTTSFLPCGLLDELRQVLSARHHVLTSRELAEIGVSSEAVRALIKAGELTRVGRGAYVATSRLSAADRDGQHRLRTLAIARTWPEGVAVSHGSAALMWGLPLTASPDRVHGSRTGAGQYRRASTYTIHTGYPVAKVFRLRGARVLEPAFAVLGVLEQSGVSEAVVAGDTGLHTSRFGTDDLERAAACAGHLAVRRRLERAVTLMDPACESPGESLSRLLLGRLGYTVQSQVEVRTAGGLLLGRLDFVIEGTRVAVEFDGMVKYGERMALVNEKRRELALQRAGYIVVRLVWSDLSQPERVRRLIGDAIAADRARSA